MLVRFPSGWHQSRWSSFPLPTATSRRSPSWPTGSASAICGSSLTVGANECRQRSATRNFRRCRIWRWSATKSWRQELSIFAAEKAVTRLRLVSRISFDSLKTSRGYPSERPFVAIDRVVYSRVPREAVPSSHLQAGAEEVKGTKIASRLSFFVHEGGLIHGI